MGNLLLLPLAVAAANLGAVGLMVALQYVIRGEIPARNTIIPGTTNQRFAYVQDYWCIVLGDTVGLTLIQTAWAGYLAGGGNPSSTIWMLLICVAITDAQVFNWPCTGNHHRRDWSYPRVGVTSLAGRFHEIYHGANVAIALGTAILLVQGELATWMRMCAIVGVAVYAASLVMDFRKGNFEPHRPEESAS